jgi:gluconate kinase
MKANMLASQFDDLEEPSGAIIVDIAQPPDAIVEQILTGISHPTTAAASTPP